VAVRECGAFLSSGKRRRFISGAGISAAVEGSERLNRGIRQRIRVVGAIHDGKGALILIATRLKHVADSEWDSRRYLDVTLLES
jgi:hypothetical protein